MANAFAGAIDKRLPFCIQATEINANISHQYGAFDEGFN